MDDIPDKQTDLEKKEKKQGNKKAKGLKNLHRIVGD